MKRWISAAIFLLPALVQLCRAAPTTQPTVGYIVSPDNKPVAGAKVFQISSDWQNEQTLATAITDSRGIFQLPPTTQPSNLLVQAAGFGLSIAHPSDSIAQAQNAPSELHPATVLRLQFVDADGKPAAGVKVAPQLLLGSRMSDGTSGIPPELQPALTQTTDANGVCAFESLPAGMRLRLNVLDERFAQLDFSSQIFLSTGPVSDGGIIHLKPASTISGRVTFADSHQPAPGVRVGAQPTDPGVILTTGFAVTDAQGNFTLKQMCAGMFNIALDLKGDSANQYTAVAHEHLKLDSGQQLTNADFQLIRGGLIRGKVTVKGSDRPVEGVFIGVYGPAHPRSTGWVQTAKTGADGSYQLRVPPGDQYVYFQSYPPPGLEAPNPSSANISVVDNDTTKLDFQLEERPAQAQANDQITGRTVDPDGKPISGAQILMTHPSRSPIPSIEFTQSDANGSFTFANAPAGCIIKARAGKLTTVEATTLGHDRAPITLVLHPDSMSSAKVQVITEEGSPLPGAEVMLFQQEGSGYSGIDTKHTESDGTCIFKNLYPDEKYSIQVTAPRRGHVWKNINITPGQQAEINSVTPPKADSFISGTVVDEAGKPVPDVQVETNSSASGNQKATTDVFGQFKLENLVPGDKVLVFMRGSQLHSTQSVLAGTEGITLTYQPKDPQDGPP